MKTLPPKPFILSLSKALGGDELRFDRLTANGRGNGNGFNGTYF
jgi:hypothetical protein